MEIGDIVVPANEDTTRDYGPGPFRIAQLFEKQLIVEHLDGGQVRYRPGDHPTRGSSITSWKVDVFLNAVDKSHGG